MKTERIRGRELERILERVRRRDNDLCQDCRAKGFVVIGEQVDHTVPLEHGGAETDDNRRLLCKPCHLLKTAKDRGYRPTGCDANGNPTDPRHHWSKAT